MEDEEEASFGCHLIFYDLHSARAFCFVQIERLAGVKSCIVLLSVHPLPPLKLVGYWYPQRPVWKWIECTERLVNGEGFFFFRFRDDPIPLFFYRTSTCISVITNTDTKSLTMPLHIIMLLLHSTFLSTYLNSSVFKRQPWHCQIVGSIPTRVFPKTLKMVPIVSLFATPSTILAWSNADDTFCILYLTVNGTLTLILTLGLYSVLALGLIANRIGIRASLV